MTGDPTTEGARPPPRPTATIRDVARDAGVSIATVSKALNGNGRLRQETRDRVRSTAQRLGFRPNDLAQSLHRGRSLTVGLLSNDSYGRFTMPILDGLERSLSANRMSVLLCNAADDPENERRHLDTLLSKRVDGIILAGRRIDSRFFLDSRQIGVPTLFVHARGDHSDASCLLPDDCGGARLATEHLIGLGRRRIVHVTGPEEFEAVRSRATGFRLALRNAGAEHAAHILPGRWSEAWGRSAAHHLFEDAGSAPDAIFCGSDQIARGVTDALRELGARVPDDVAVVGYDNWDVMAAAARPPLTTVDPKLQGLGGMAGRTLLEMIADATRHHGTRHAPCELVIRQSCGATTN